MKQLFVSLFVAVVIVSVHGKALVNDDDQPKLWAVLVAGSNGYYNYRHQADVCHAYQILHAHGIPDERIIVMMYDDIAHSFQNPTKGIIVNHLNGKDVYKDVPKDYTGKHVTPEAFLDILQGKVPKGGSGKTLKAGPNDHVFVNFVDHGAPGILAFPRGTLTVKDLMNTLKTTSENKKYGKMVMYVEACESGSMFKNHLPDNINIFATTAANDHESSYACYYDSKRHTYLGDWYSVNWMEDSDRENIESLSLEKQFVITKNETKQSHAQQFGDMTISKMTVGQFQGLQNPPKNDVQPKMAPTDVVESTDVPLRILENQLLELGFESWEKKLEIMEQIAQLMLRRQELKGKMEKFASTIAKDQDQADRVLKTKKDLQDLDCHDTVVKHLDTSCLPIYKHNYMTRFVYMLVNMCEEGISAQEITKGIDSMCAEMDQNEDVVYM